MLPEEQGLPAPEILNWERGWGMEMVVDSCKHGGVWEKTLTYQQVRRGRAIGMRSRDALELL